jgi:hypothetical protein
MISIIVTIILVSAFFILFFGGMGPENKKEKKKVNKPEASTTAGFIEDTYRDPFINHFIPPKVGNIGKFVPYSGVPENHWLHGFPHKKAK